MHNTCVIVVLHVGRGIDGYRLAYIEENEKFLAARRDFIENKGDLSKMFRYTLYRVAQSIITILIIITIVFLILYIVPGDPAYIILGDRATPETVAALRTSLGLNKPLFVQYYDRLKGFIRLDFGKSLYDKKPIGPELVIRLGRSFEIIVATMILSSLVAIPLGICAASGSKFLDLLISSFSIIGLTLPSIVCGPILSFLMGVKWKILPSSGFISAGTNLIGHLTFLVMPVLSVAFFTTGIITRMTRSCVLDNIRKDYARTAKSKGLTDTQVLFKHVLKNSMIPIFTLIGMRMGMMLSATVIAEALFNWPGISTYLIDAVYVRDYPVIQAVVLSVAVVFVFLNLLVDLLVGVLDPRIRYN